MTREHALTLRSKLVKASASLSDSDALEAVELFDRWAINIAYEVGQRINYNEKLYRCEQAHTSQEGWQPTQTPALWTEVAEPGTIPVWRQPTGTQDAYMTGDKVYYPDKYSPIYISTIDFNTWAPDVYGWEEVTS